MFCSSSECVVITCRTARGRACNLPRAHVQLVWPGLGPGPIGCDGERRFPPRIGGGTTRSPRTRQVVVVPGVRCAKGADAHRWWQAGACCSSSLLSWRFIRVACVSRCCSAATAATRLTHHPAGACVAQMRPRLQLRALELELLLELRTLLAVLRDVCFKDLDLLLDPALPQSCSCRSRGSQWTRTGSTRWRRSCSPSPSGAAPLLVCFLGSRWKPRSLCSGPRSP